MKNLVSLIIIISVFLMLNSCHKDRNEDAATLYHTWEAKNFMSIESVAYPKNENIQILLTFSLDGSYHLKLDINNCGGSFSSGQNNQLEMDFPACTEACCDSQFSQKLATMLPQVTSYEIEGNILKLYVTQWGWIECELVE